MVPKIDFSKKDKIFIAVALIVVATLLITLLVIVRGMSKAKDEAETVAVQSQTPAVKKVSPTAIASITATSISSSSPAPTTTATEDPNRDLNSAKAAVVNFLSAYVDRDLEQAKPYMTEAFYKTYSQDSFAGVSSPSRGEYEITGAEVLKQGYVYKVKAYLHLMLSGSESGTEVLEFEVVKDGNTYLVSSLTAN